MTENEEFEKAFECFKSQPRTSWDMATIQTHAYFLRQAYAHAWQAALQTRQQGCDYFADGKYDAGLKDGKSEKQQEYAAVFEEIKYEDEITPSAIAAVVRELGECQRLLDWAMKNHNDKKLSDNWYAEAEIYCQYDRKAISRPQNV